MSSPIHYFGEGFAQLGVVLVSYTPNIAPDGRGTYNYVYTGTAKGIGSAADRLRAMGATINVEYNGGSSRLSASFNFQPNNGSTNGPADSTLAPAAETPVDRYEVLFSSVSVSLFALPKAVAEAYSYSGSTETNVAQYRKDIQELVDKGNEYNLGTSYPFGKTIYRSLSRGVDSEQVLRPTIRRTRTYSYAYAQRRRITFDEYVYKRESLFSTFSLPTDLDAVLPFEPTADPLLTNTVWAYKITDQTLQYNQPKRSWEESVTWEYGAWDTGIYTSI